MFRTSTSRRIIPALLCLNAFLGAIALTNGSALPSLGGGTYPEIEAVQGANWDFRELNNFFTVLAREKGGGYAFAALTEAAEKGYLTPNVDTHLLGHGVGDELYRQEGLDGMRYCTHGLRNACSHSIVIGAFLKYGPGIFDRISDACEKAPGGKGAYRMCFHGFGHGVLAYAEYDLADGVSLCQQAGRRNVWDQESVECVGGMIMEMIGGVHDRDAWMRQKPLYFSDADPLKPCNTDLIPPEAKAICYTYLTPNLFQAAGADLANPTAEHFKTAFTYCEDIADSSLQRVCAASLGKEFVVLVNSRNVQTVENMSDGQLETIYQWCALASNRSATESCMLSALSSLYWGGENDIGAAARYCTLIPDADHQDACIGELIGQVRYYIDDPRQRSKLCALLPEDEFSRCSYELPAA